MGNCVSDVSLQTFEKATESAPPPRLTRATSTSGGARARRNPQGKTFVARTPGERDDDDLDPVKSVRLIAEQGPFVDQATAEQLRKFYKKFAPQKDEEHIIAIIRTGVSVATLNEKLREKYGCDLTDYETHPAPLPQMSVPRTSAQIRASTKSRISTKSWR